MPINTQYYGSESTWITFNPLNGSRAPATDYKVAQFNDVDISSTYGTSSRIWLAGKFGNDFQDNYFQNLDLSFGWCRTDGTAPFDHVYSISGYDSGSGTVYDKTRRESNMNGQSTIGLQVNGSHVTYTSSDYVQYFKIRATGGIQWDNAPLNYKPTGFNFTPTITEESNGFIYARVSESCLTPVLKFDFGRVIYTPFIDYYKLKSQYTVSDWQAVTVPGDYAALVDGSQQCSDLRSFYEIVNRDNLSNRIVIISVRLIARHFDWLQDKTYGVNDAWIGTTSNSSGALSPLAISDTDTEFTFTNWYKQQDPETYTVNINITLPNNARRALGSCNIYDEKNSQISSAVINTQCAITISGCKISQYGAGYMAPTTYCYCIQPLIADSTNYVVKRYETDTTLSTAQRYAVTAYTTISQFTDLDGFREYVRKSTAYFGAYFTESYYPDVTSDWHEIGAFIGTIDSNGVTHGAYTQGTANDTQPQKQWGEDWAGKTPYKPGKPPKPDQDPNNYINGMPGTNQLSIASFTRLYAMTPNDLTYLRAYLKYIPTQYTDFDAYRDFLGQKFLNSNPIDNMVSLRWYPFDVVDNVMVFLPITQPIQISNAIAQWTESGATYTVQGTTSLYPVYYFTLYLGSFTPQTAYGNFLDYEPYSDAKMYLPFCGTASIDLKSVLDVTLYVSYKVDVRTGACTAIVAADDYDGNIILTGHGSLAVEVPITGVQSADYQNAVFQAINNLKNAQIAQFTAYVQSATGLIGAAATTAANPLAGIGAAGNAVSGIAGAMQAENNLKQAQYDLKTAQVKHTVVGSTSAGDGSMMYLYPALIVNRPAFIYGYNPDVYAHTVGNACILSDTLGAFTGFTVVSAIDLDNVQATETEKNMIRSILAAGIYL